MSRRMLVIVAVVLAVVLAATRCVGVSTVVSASMAPRLEVGDRIVVNKLVPEVFGLRQGDLAVFEDPGGWAEISGRSRGAGIRRDTLIVKRVIGVAGDHVVCCTPDGALEVNGRRLSEPYVRERRPIPAAFDVVVPPGSFWVMGDNRARSFDSSSLGAGGFVPAARIVGRVI